MDVLIQTALQLKMHAPNAKQCHLEHEGIRRDRTIVSTIRVKRDPQVQIKTDEEALTPAERETVRVPGGPN